MFSHPQTITFLLAGLLPVTEPIFSSSPHPIRIRLRLRLVALVLSASKLSEHSITFPLFQVLKMLCSIILEARRRLLKLLTRRVWKHVVQKGDVVVDATCGNGYDTLALLKLVKDDSSNVCVYGFDIQEDAINNTSSLLDMSLGPTERKCVKLFSVCHSKMLQLLPKGIAMRLVAFNLGYLPGSDKSIITKSSTTLLALEAAKELLVPGGLISAVVYVGHPGGREEFETIQGFAAGLSAEEWVCTEIQMLNRPSAPILVFLFKR